MRHGHKSRGGERVLMQAEIGTQIEVVFAHSSRWYRIGMHPEAIQTVQSGADLGIAPRRAFIVQFLKYIEFILKSLDFSQGFQIQLQFLHSGIQTEKCSQNLLDTQKGIHVYT
jgi:hypothetical protein